MVEVCSQLKIVITPVPKPPKPVDACVVAPKAGAAGLAAPKSPPPAGWAAPNAVVPVGIVFKMSINSSIDSSFFRTCYDLKHLLNSFLVKNINKGKESKYNSPTHLIFSS